MHVVNRCFYSVKEKDGMELGTTEDSLVAVRYGTLGFAVFKHDVVETITPLEIIEAQAA